MEKKRYKCLTVEESIYELLKRTAKQLNLPLGKTIKWIVDNPDKAYQFSERIAQMQRDSAKCQKENIELRARLDELRRSKMTKKEREDADFDEDYVPLGIRLEEDKKREKEERKILKPEMVKSKVLDHIGDALLDWGLIDLEAFRNAGDKRGQILEEATQQFYEHYSTKDPDYSEEMYAKTYNVMEFYELSDKAVPNPIPKDHIGRFIVKWGEEELGHPFDTEFYHYEGSNESLPSSVFTSSGE